MKRIAIFLGLMLLACAPVSAMNLAIQDGAVSVGGALYGAAVSVYLLLAAIGAHLAAKALTTPRGEPRA